MGSDDSTGKSKITEGKARNKAVLSVFAVGLCIGMVIAERVYVSRGGRVGSARQLTAVDAGLQHVTAAEKGDTWVDYPDTKPPRNDLEKLLREIAPNKEVFVAVSNKNTLWDNMLETFCNGILRSGIKNHLLVVLDEETKKWADEHKVNAYLQKVVIPKSQQGTGDNHAVSSMKFGILKQFIELGWSVLLSDVDIAVLQNPFNYLYRDSDVEGMTDGFDEHTAYGSIEGFDDATMGWARYAQYYKHFNLNSGLFYLRAGPRTLNLMVRLEQRLSREKYWDQTAYNEEIFFLSHGDYKSPQVTVRVMDIDKFMNSKRLFKDLRHRPKEQQPPLPVMVHINYHPDKHERMKAVIKYYVDKDEHALDSFPGGSEKGSR